jgi:parallel beta-helix repeat protein
MRLRSKTKSLLVSILLVSLLLSFIPRATLQGEEQNGIDRKLVDSVVAGTPHGPIVISGDGEFKLAVEAESWDGQGSESDPYIIENFDFDLGGTNGRCIDISDTTVHFIIRDCTLTGASGFGGVGIYLYNVTNCEVSENILFNNYVGIYFDADNATIVNNEILSTESSGIYSSSTMYSLISGNTINGGHVGLNLWYAESCEVSDNTVTNSIEASMYLPFSENVTVSDNDFINGTLWGLYLEWSDSCTLIRNTISLCGDGIFITYSYNNSIKECTLERNTNGIVFDFLGTSSVNVVEFCEIRDNVERGIIADSTRNLFRWNVFVNNSFGDAFDDGVVNIFDYNYYDYYSGPDVDGNMIGDFPQLIPGSAGNNDPHPLLLLPTYPVWGLELTNQNIEFGNEFSYSLEVSSPIPIGEWDISDTIHFVIDDTGIIRDIDVLDVGTYPIDIVVTNVYGLSLEGSFTVTVEDSASPVWISQIQDKTFVYGDDIEIQLMAWDLSGIGSWDISDSGNFSLSSASFAETGILTIIGIENTLTVTVTASGAGVGDGGTMFIMSTAGLSVGILALVVAIITSLKSRKSS